MIQAFWNWLFKPAEPLNGRAQGWLRGELGRKPGE